MYVHMVDGYRKQTEKKSGLDYREIVFITSHGGFSILAAFELNALLAW